jgi:hypothetical protein
MMNIGEATTGIRSFLLNMSGSAMAFLSRILTFA